MDEGWQAKTIWVLTWQPCQPSGNGKEHTTNRGTSGFQYGLVSYWGGNSSQSCSEKESINQQTPSPQQHGTSCSQHVKVATIRVTRTELFRCFRNLVFEKPLCLENCAIPQNRGTQGRTRFTVCSRSSELFEKYQKIRHRLWKCETVKPEVVIDLFQSNKSLSLLYESYRIILF